MMIRRCNIPFLLVALCVLSSSVPAKARTCSWDDAPATDKQSLRVAYSAGQAGQWLRYNRKILDGISAACNEGNLSYAERINLIEADAYKDAVAHKLAEYGFDRKQLDAEWSRAPQKPKQYVLRQAAIILGKQPLACSDANYQRWFIDETGMLMLGYEYEGEITRYMLFSAVADSLLAEGGSPPYIH